MEAAKKPRNSKAASPLGQGLGRSSPGSFFFLPLFTYCVDLEFSDSWTSALRSSEKFARFA